jgi:predicted PhzF superfamily epimerase YddE/YHI9
MFDEERTRIMKIPIYQVDAFTSDVFSGNPAAICILDSWIDDSMLQSTAAENNLSETAFLVRNDDGFDLRWFTPTTEVALCGHATLASAFVLFACQDWSEEEIRFHTRKSGQLIVGKRNDLLEMDFPSRPVHSRIPPSGLKEALGATPIAILSSVEDLLVVLESERAVRELQPDFSALERVECRGIVFWFHTGRANSTRRIYMRFRYQSAAANYSASMPEIE